MNQRTSGLSLRVLCAKQPRRFTGDCFAKNARNDGHSAIFGIAGTPTFGFDLSLPLCYNPLHKEQGMKITLLPAEQAVGKILCHNLDDSSGHKAFAKGHIVQPEEIDRLKAIGYDNVYVVILDEGDIPEDAAATRMAQAVMGSGVEATRAVTGRVNLLAGRHGVVHVNGEALKAINSIDGLTTATLRTHSVIEAGKIAATVKIIPYAVAETSLRRAEEIGRASGGIISVWPLLMLKVALVLTGSDRARQQVTADFEPPLRDRIVTLGSQPLPAVFVPEQSQAIAQAIKDAVASGAGMIIIAGQTSIMDGDDITPQGIRLAGGEIEHYGVPVEPGNLLLLAYLGSVPIMGAPGCARSRHTNVVDLVLPRLLTGERVQRQDLIALGDGGLL
jgi:hypothetical protein